MGGGGGLPALLISPLGLGERARGGSKVVAGRGEKGCTGGRSHGWSGRGRSGGEASLFSGERAGQVRGGGGGLCVVASVLKLDSDHNVLSSKLPGSLVPLEGFPLSPLEETTALGFVCHFDLGGRGDGGVGVPRCRVVSVQLSVCGAHHRVFGLLLCFVSAAGLEGRVTRDRANRRGK